MTRDELLQLLVFLENIRNYEDIYDMMMVEECDKLILIVKNNIKARNNIHAPSSPVNAGHSWIRRMFIDF